MGTRQPMSCGKNLTPLQTPLRSPSTQLQNKIPGRLNHQFAEYKPSLIWPAMPSQPKRALSPLPRTTDFAHCIDHPRRCAKVLCAGMRS